MSIKKIIILLIFIFVITQIPVCLYLAKTYNLLPSAPLVTHRSTLTTTPSLTPYSASVAIDTTNQDIQKQLTIANAYVASASSIASADNASASGEDVSKHITQTTTDLTNLINEISNENAIPHDQAVTLSDQIQSNIQNLQTLQKKVSITSNPLLLQGYQSMLASYNVSAILEPKVYYSLALAHLSVLSTELSLFFPKISQVVTTLPKSSSTSLNLQLIQLNAKLSDVTILLISSNTTLNTINPSHANQHLFPGVIQNIAQITKDDQTILQELQTISKGLQK